MNIQIRKTIAVFSLIVMLVATLISPVLARPKNFMQRHPTLTAAAAGIGTTTWLKHRAEWKREHGEKLNFAERHPYLSGFGVAVVTHHVIKESTN